MFYRTQIKYAGVGYAVDTTGKRLAFIGRIPCKAGDFVWTDGNVIFGDISHKPQPVLFNDITSGMPIILEIDGVKKAGYFDAQTNFKKYSIANDEWIVNDERKFFHGKYIEDDIGDMIDAEISTDGQLLTLRLSDSDFIVKKNKEVLATYDISNLRHYYTSDESNYDILGKVLFPDGSVRATFLVTPQKTSLDIYGIRYFDNKPVILQYDSNIGFFATITEGQFFIEFPDNFKQRLELKIDEVEYTVYEQGDGHEFYIDDDGNVHFIDVGGAGETHTTYGVTITKENAFYYGNTKSALLYYQDTDGETKPFEDFFFFGKTANAFLVASVWWKLYSVKDNEVKFVGESPANYRYRFLKDISKARR